MVEPQNYLDKLLSEQFAQSSEVKIDKEKVNETFINLKEKANEYLASFKSNMKHHIMEAMRAGSNDIQKAFSGKGFYSLECFEPDTTILMKITNIPVDKYCRENKIYFLKRSISIVKRVIFKIVKLSDNKYNVACYVSTTNRIPNQRGAGEFATGSDDSYGQYCTGNTEIFEEIDTLLIRLDTIMKNMSIIGGDNPFHSFNLVMANVVKIQDISRGGWIGGDAKTPEEIEAEKAATAAKVTDRILRGATTPPRTISTTTAIG